MSAIVDDAGKERRGIGRNITVLASGQLVTWSMTLVWTLVVPRKLGPAGLGTVMAALSISGIFGIALGLGTRNYLVRMSVVDPAEAPRRLGTTISARVLLSPVVFAAAVAYGSLVHWGTDAKIVLYLAAASTVLVQIAEPLQAGFQSVERMEYLAYSDVISKSGQGLVGIAVVVAGAGAIGVTACMAVMAALVVVLDIYWMRGRFTVDLRTNVRRMANVTRESAPYWAFGVFMMIYLWIDFVMLSLMTHNDVVGWYGVPTRIFQTLMFLPVVVATAWLPRLVREHESGGPQFAEIARKPLELILLVSLPIAAMTAVTASPAIHFLYGPAYAHSIPVMGLLGLSIPPMYLNIVLGQVLIATGRQTGWTWVMVSTIVVNPLFNVALIPVTQHRFHNGAIGAAIALFLTELVVVALALKMIGRRIFDRRSARRAALAFLIACAMWLSGTLVRHAAGGMASIVAAVAAFVVLAAALRLFTPEEVRAIRSGFARAARKLPFVRRFALAQDMRPVSAAGPGSGS